MIEIEIDFQHPEVSLGKLLKEQNLTITTAESCTAGGIANLIASVPGSSDYLVGGVITYATEAKYKLLGVSENTVKEHNVVSANVAMEMAAGAMKLFNTDVSIGITGLAGPNDVDGIPAGTIYIAVATRSDKKLPNPDAYRVFNCNFDTNDRADNISKAIYNAVLVAAEEVKTNFPLLY